MDTNEPKEAQRQYREAKRRIESDLEIDLDVADYTRASLRRAAIDKFNRAMQELDLQFPEESQWKGNHK